MISTKLNQKKIIKKRPERVNNRPYRAEKEADAVLILEDGSVFWGKGAGREGNVVGELCFNTAMTGYQESLSDPSFAGQIINFTFPHIGNVGVNADDEETKFPFALGMVSAVEMTEFSNYRGQENLDTWLKKHGLIAITGLDTRALTHKIRDGGAPRALIAYKKIVNPTEDASAKKTAKTPKNPSKKRIKKFDTKALLNKVRKWSGLENMDLAKDVTAPSKASWQEKLYKTENLTAHLFDNQAISQKNRKQDWAHIVAIDYGAKHNILRHLASLNAKITTVPANYSAAKIIALKPDGVFLSNGPGDPAATAKYSSPILQELLKSKIPMFGICLGHQLLSLALGAKTEKMHQGHRGANHPVKNLKSGAVEITSQNHGFKVLAESLPKNVDVTHISLFDETLEGMACKDMPVFSVQYHPEASPGPHDSHYLFEDFALLIEKSLTKSKPKD